MRLSREPALLLLALLAPVVQMVTALFLTNDPIVTGTVNAVAVAVAGLITAAAVRSDNLLPAITGLAQAVLALVISLGLYLSDAQQASIMVPVGIIAAFVVRDRVEAPAPRTVVGGSAV